MDHTFSDEPEAVRKTLWQFWPLRLIVFFVVLIAAYVGCQLMQVLLPPRLTFLPAEVVLTIFTALGIAILITLYRLLVRWTEHRAVTELGAARSSALHRRNGDWHRAVLRRDRRHRRLWRRGPARWD